MQKYLISNIYIFYAKRNKISSHNLVKKCEKKSFLSIQDKNMQFFINRDKKNVVSTANQHWYDENHYKYHVTIYSIFPLFHIFEKIKSTVINILLPTYQYL